SQIAGYSETELQHYADTYPERYPQPFHADTSPATTIGQQIVLDGQAYVDGVNGYIQSTLTDPRRLPAEYPALQTFPAPWKVTVGPITIDLTDLMPPPYATHHMSNELMVDAAHSVGHHPIAVFGPQTGYFSPEILHEIDLHGPGLQARGVSFPGTEVFVELGHGVDYAWSATSASADLIDQRVEKLCNMDGSPPSLLSTGYMYFGNCRPMFERTDRQID